MITPKLFATNLGSTVTTPIPARNSKALLQPQLTAARPLWVRLFHWLIAFGEIVMVFSGFLKLLGYKTRNCIKNRQTISDFHE